MVAIQFRMGAGFPGSVNRTRPVTMLPALNDETNPVLGYGLACVYTGSPDQAVRTMEAGDTGLSHIDGVVVRPFVQQAPTSPQPYGGTGTVASPFGDAGTPPAGSPIDICKMGLIIVPIVGTPNLGDPVYVWIAASGGGHTQGGFEAAPTGGSTIALSTDGRIYFNGPPDANGNGELAFNL
jgi:hypothetical protein